MAGSSVRTDGRFQLAVYAAIALISALMMGLMITQLQSSTIRWAASLLLVGMLLTIAYLAIEL